MSHQDLSALVSDFNALSAQLLSMQARLETALASEVKTVSTPSAEPARPRDAKGRYLPTSKKAPGVKTASTPKAKPAEPAKVTPVALSTALASAKVGETVAITGLSKRDVNKLVSASGGTWDSKAWVDAHNGTYRFNGHTFAFDNVKAWKAGDTRQRGMTRIA